MCGSKPKMPSAQPMQQQPINNAQEEAQKKATEEAKMKEKKRAKRSTLLTGPEGVTDQAKLSKSSLLGAK